MLFNTLEFSVFFAIVYSLYVILNHKWQNRMLLLASYVFYGAWDARFLFLIWLSTIIDFICGLQIDHNKDLKKRKLFLFLSIAANLSILGFFKYFNFFAVNLQSLFAFFGFSIEPRFLNIVLPVGISFYTFQTMSYTIDIYNRKLKATNRFFDFALFVSFFPQLVAGPIERAKHLLPQILNPRKVRRDWFYEGCYLILWGLFLKIFIADNLAHIVDHVFHSSKEYNGFNVLVALYAFAFQIFGDFAGYSNIARGLGRCMGFDIMVNFKLPYFAVNPSDFWKRWHISLSSWLKDYLYIPLGGNKQGDLLTYRNLTLTMLLGGLWHGASWTFVIWGAYQGALLIGHRLMLPVLKRIPSIRNSFIHQIISGLKVFILFNVTCLGWLIFRSSSVNQVMAMLKSLMFKFFPLNDFEIINMFSKEIVFLFIIIIIQYVQYIKKDLMVLYKMFSAFPFYIKGVIYFFIYFVFMTQGVEGGKEFIYFQF